MAKIEVTEATGILTLGTDKVFLKVEDFPSAAWPFEDVLSLEFEAAKGSGVEYCRKHFGIEPKVVNSRT